MRRFTLALPTRRTAHLRVGRRPGRRRGRSGRATGDHHPGRSQSVRRHQVITSGPSTGTGRCGIAGTTIAHGFMTLALLPPATPDVHRQRTSTGNQPGLNKVRFPAPVPVGSRVRATKLAGRCRGSGQRHRCRRRCRRPSKVEGSASRCVAESIVRYVAWQLAVRIRRSRAQALGPARRLGVRAGVGIL